MRKMKNEKEIKRNLKNELNDTEPSSSLQNRVFSELNVKETKKTFSFRKWVPALTCCLCVALIAVVGLVVGNSISKNNKAYNAIVQVDVNPSIEMVVDEKNQVLSVRGLNDEGKMVLEGEAFIGKNVDDVVGEIIRIETELGYLVVGKDDNKVTVTVSAETDKISEKINTQIYGTIAKVCEELNLTAVIENVKGYVIDEIKALAKELDPTLTEEEINNFTYTQLVNVVKLYHLEVADLASVKIEELYRQAKEYDISFVEKEAVKEAVDKLDITYQATIGLYDIAYEKLADAYEYVQNKYKEYFINSDSEYVIALEKLAKEKEALLLQRNLVAQLPEDTDSEVRVNETNKLARMEAEYALHEKALKDIEDSATQAYNTVCEVFETVLASMKSLEEKLPESIKEITFASLTNTEAKLNEFKNNFFAKFETEHKDDILAAKQKLANRKQELKDSLHQKSEE